MKYCACKINAQERGAVDICVVRNSVLRIWNGQRQEKQENVLRLEQRTAGKDVVINQLLKDSEGMREPRQKGKNIVQYFHCEEMANIQRCQQ